MPVLTVLAILTGLLAEHGAWLFVVAAFLALFMLGELVRKHPVHDAPRSLSIAPDYIGVEGQRIPMKDVRRIEQLRAGGAHEILVHVEQGATLVARTPNLAHARYIADRVDDAYRAFLRKGSLS